MKLEIRCGGAHPYKTIAKIVHSTFLIFILLALGIIPVDGCDRKTPKNNYVYFIEVKYLLSTV